MSACADSWPPLRQLLLLLAPGSRQRTARPSPSARAKQQEPKDLTPGSATISDDDARVAVATRLAWAYPPSAKTRSMKGNKRREACRSSPPPSRS